MKLWNLTLERVRQMENELEAKTEEMRLLKVCGMFVFLTFCFLLVVPESGAATKANLCTSRTKHCFRLF